MNSQKIQQEERKLMRKWPEGQIRFTSLLTKDAKALKEFAENVFQWKFKHAIETSDGDFYMFETPGGARGGIGQVGKNGVFQYVNSIPYVEVDDINEASRRIEGTGGEIVLHPTEVPHQGWQLIFRYKGSPLIGCWQDLASE